MFTMNNVLVQGYVGRITSRDGEIIEHPIVRRTTQGKAVCNFSIATTERWKSEGIAQEKTTWHQITCWEAAAERAGEYVKQGKFISIQGRLENRQYISADGTKNRISEIVCRQLDLGPDRGWKGQTTDRATKEEEAEVAGPATGSFVIGPTAPTAPTAASTREEPAEDEDPIPETTASPTVNVSTPPQGELIPQDSPGSSNDSSEASQA